MTSIAFQPVIDELLQIMPSAQTAYYRLILLIGTHSPGKTNAMDVISETLGVPMINVGLELSSRLLELTTKQRALRLPEVLAEAVGSGSHPVILDNTEILFDKNLHQDPLRLLQGVARNRLILASWTGHIDGGKLLYAEPGHDEYRQYPVNDFFAVEMNSRC